MCDVLTVSESGNVVARRAGSTTSQVLGHHVTVGGRYSRYPCQVDVAFGSLQMAREIKARWPAGEQEVSS
jgi:hypothetical protein